MQCCHVSKDEAHRSLLRKSVYALHGVYRSPPFPEGSKASTSTSTSTSSQPAAGSSSRLPTALVPMTSSPFSAPEASKLELEAVFRFMDADGDGRVSLEELQTVLRALGSQPSEEQLRGMIQEVDSDGDGFISLDEFLAFNAAGTASLVDLRAAFHVFDLDGNGYISRDELQKTMLAVGEKDTTDDACSQMIRGVDADGDGQVNFDEFKVMMAAKSSQ